MITITNKTPAEVLVEMTKTFGSPAEMARAFAELINAVESPVILHASATKEEYQNAWENADKSRCENASTVRVARCLNAELAYRRLANSKTVAA